MERKFSIIEGLYLLVPEAKFTGDISLESKEAYDNIKWLDYRDKPKWEDVETESIKVLKKFISEEINIKTNDIICNNFKTSINSEVSIKSSTEWQFDMLNLWLIRDSGMIDYPYSVHVGSDMHSKPVYIILNDAKDLNVLYMEMFGFITTTLTTGRAEKTKLNDLSILELENYTDER